MHDIADAVGAFSGFGFDLDVHSVASSLNEGGCHFHGSGLGGSFGLDLGSFALLRSGVSGNLLFLFFCVSNVRSFNLFDWYGLHFKAAGLSDSSSYGRCLKSIGSLDGSTSHLHFLDRRGEFLILSFDFRSASGGCGGGSVALVSASYTKLGDLLLQFVFGDFSLFLLEG